MLGDILRKERERQNLTVKDIERDTSIRGLYISAIENGEYDLLPGEVYLKGFIRSYAEYLKLDGAALLQQYYAEKGPIEAPVNPVGNSEAVKAASVETPAGAKTEFRERVEKSRQTQKILIGLAAAGLVFGGIYMVPLGVILLTVKRWQLSLKTESRRQLSLRYWSVLVPTPWWNARC